MSTPQWDSRRILNTSGNFWQACTIHAAVAMDVFTVIGDGAVTAKTVAKKIDGDSRGTQTLLNALSAMALLIKKKDRYENTPEAQTFLSKASDQYIGHIIAHHRHLVPSWARLDESVRTGGPVKTSSSHSGPEERKSFLMGMFNLAMQLAPRLVPLIDLSDRRRLLDLGGGPGTYAVHFCKENPTLTATVFDLPTSRPFALEIIEKFKMDDRVAFFAGNFLKDELPDHYDAVWMSHILHGEGPEDCRKIIEKAAASLMPGGLMMIHEFILNNRMDGPLFPALFSLNMLSGTEKGRAYSEKQLTEMLSAAGAKNIHRIPVETPNDSGIIIGVF